MSDAILLTPAGIIVLTIYFVVLLGLGYLGKRARKTHSLADFGYQLKAGHFLY